VRPALRAGLLPLWRDADTIQLGVDPRRAVALTGVGGAAVMIGLLDGSRDRQQLLAAAAEVGIQEALAERVLTLLAAAGVLVDFPAALVKTLPWDLRPMLLPEMAAVSLAGLDTDGGAQVLARRAAGSVLVCGSDPIARSLAEILTASGVAAMLVADVASVCDLAARRDSAAARGPSARRAAQPAAPSLVVLTGCQPAGHPPSEAGDSLVRDRIAHLAVSAGEAIGAVGPLVRPGITACLRCTHLTRADKDPSWPLILAQLAGRQPQPAACDAVLAAAVAAQAAAQALHYIDRPGLPGPAEDATLELLEPGWQWRRRTWLPHPACICRAAAAS